MSTPKRARAAAACRVARIDRIQFNNAVQSGHYPHAPTEKVGNTRVFDVDDMIALFIYGRLVYRGFTPALAGSHSERVRSALRTIEAQVDNGKERSKTAVIAETIRGDSFCAPGNDVNLDADLLNESPIVATSIYHVENVRSLILKGLDEEAGIIGEDDE